MRRHTTLKVASYAMPGIVGLVFVAMYARLGWFGVGILAAYVAASLWRLRSAAWMRR